MMGEELKDSPEYKMVKLFSDEAQNYRKHLEKQFVQLKTAIVIIIVVGLATFTFLVGKTRQEVSEQISAAVNEKMINMKFEKDLETKVTETVSREIDSKLKSETTVKYISDNIQKSVDRRITGEIENRLNKSINDKIGAFKTLDVTSRLHSVPIGTVVSSMLPPQIFSKVINDPEEFDPKQSKWSLADGREVSNSSYTYYTNQSHIPDLRGMFIRGINAGRNDGKQDLDGEGRSAGDFQNESTKKPQVDFRTASAGNHGHDINMVSGHIHNMSLTGSHIHRHNGPDNQENSYVGKGQGRHQLGPHEGPAYGGFVLQKAGDHMHTIQEAGAHSHSMSSSGEHSHSVLSGGDAETRPKNIAVYYYIKIN
jgi:hypothetical protein